MSTPIGFYSVYDGKGLTLATSTAASSLELANPYWGDGLEHINVTSFLGNATGINGIYLQGYSASLGLGTPLPVAYGGKFISRGAPNYDYIGSAILLSSEEGEQDPENIYQRWQLNTGLRIAGNGSITYGGGIAAYSNTWVCPEGVTDCTTVMRKPWNVPWSSGKYTYNPGDKISKFIVSGDTNGGYLLSAGGAVKIETYGGDDGQAGHLIIDGNAIDLRIGSAAIGINDEIITLNRATTMPYLVVGQSFDEDVYFSATNQNTYISRKLILQDPTAIPLSSNSAGTSGQIAYDNNYHYRHNGTNWTRTAMSSW
jgi:hypothetical protein